MCIIVDANAAHDLSNRTDDGKPVLRWLFNRKRRAGLILGGKLATELVKAGLTHTLVELSRAGRLHRVAGDLLSHRENTLAKQGTCQSNDLHVVALCLVTGCRLVFTRDKPLHADLRRHSEAGRRIAIYQAASHARLLTECDCIK
jgi:hypothetical protein